MKGLSETLLWRKLLRMVGHPYFDLGVILTTICCIVTLLFASREELGLGYKLILWLCGLVGCVYVGMGLWRLFGNRIRFDRDLLYGHFLRKVVCVVLLSPFVLTFVLSLPMLFGRSELTPKEVFLNSETYKAGDRGLPSWMRRQQTSPTLFWTVYYHFLDPGNQHSATTRVGRGLSGIMAILGVFLLNGLLVSSLIGWFDRRRERWISGSVRYSRWNFRGKEFAVVIGANEVVAAVIESLLSKRNGTNPNYKCEAANGNDYVVLQTSRNAEQVRAELCSHISEEAMQRVIIYNALRNSVEEIAKLHLDKASEIYVLGESTLQDGGESFHDAMNMQCVNLIVDYLAKVYEDKPCRKSCKVMFEYQTTNSILIDSDVPRDIKTYLNFVPFNRYEAWARAVMVEGWSNEDNGEDNAVGKQISYMPLEGDCGLRADNYGHVHLVIVGMSKMGVAMGAEALLQAHYPNFARAEKELAEGANPQTALRHIAESRTRITFIDTNADKEMAFFKGRYASLFELMRHRYEDVTDGSFKDNGWKDPICDSNKWNHLGEQRYNFLDVEVEFIKGEVESEGVRDYLRKVSRDESSRLTVAICLTQTHQAIAAALYMPNEVYDGAQQIWVYQREASDIIYDMMVTERSDARYKKLRPFGMLYGDYMPDRSRDVRAMLIDCAYNCYEESEWPDFNDRTNPQTKAILAKWAEMAMDLKYSNRYVADMIWQRERSKANPATVEEMAVETEILARCEHNRWNIEKLLRGYRPCNREQQDEIISFIGKDGKAFKARKNFYKNGVLRIHLDICSYERLRKVDEGVLRWDVMINEAMPKIAGRVPRSRG